MKTESLLLDDKVQFVIYGGGEVGNTCYRKLRENGCHVVAAIDKNRSGKNVVSGIDTYLVDDFPKDIYDLENLVVMICLADGLIHKSIADQLYHMGFQYIIFLPMGYCIKDSEKILLIRQYNNVLEGCVGSTGQRVRHYRNYYKKNLDAGNAVLLTNCAYYTVWLGMELLFTESLELWEGDKLKIYWRDEFKDKNIACDDSYEILFRYFDAKADDYEKYFKGYKEEKSSIQKREELQKRENLYRIFQWEHNKGMDFFIESAPHVVWNPKSYFNLVGGHHRIMYLLKEGHTLFPVVMKKADFDKWCNAQVYDKLLGFIEEHNIKSFYAPLPHPGMINFPVRYEAFGENHLKHIMRFFAHKNMASMEVLDCSGGQGYYARNMERIGVKKAVYIDEDIINVQLAVLMNELLYRVEVSVAQGKIEDIPFDEKYDLVFALDRYSGMKTNSENMTMQTLGRITARYLIIDFCCEQEKVSFLNHSGFVNEILLYREYRYGKVWSTYVLEKGEGDASWKNFEEVR